MTLIERTITAEDVLNALEDADKKILNLMPPGDYAYSSRTLSFESGLPVRPVRNILRKFHEMAIVNLTCLFDDEGKICGSGYWLNALGVQAQKLLHEGPANGRV